MATASPRPFSVSLDIPVRTYDIDFVGIVSNIVYVRWLEDLRLQVMAEYFPLRQAMEERGLSPILLRTRIDYRRPIRLFDHPSGHMWVSDVGRARLTLAAEFRVDGEVMAEAEQLCCFIDLENGRPVPIPDEIREQLQAP